ncbi:MAG: antitoxin Xre/MbcA/ParS toxin-binding domain-containing protein [Chitinophagaceae bacterium]
MAKLRQKPGKKGKVAPKKVNPYKPDNDAEASSPTVLKEAAVAYGYGAAGKTTKLRVVPQNTEDMPTASVLTIKGPFPEFRMSSFEKMEIIQDGISKKALQNLKDKAVLDYDQLAQVLNVARATLINKKGNEKFSKDVSDKILGLADIYSYGYEVFEDRARFNQWIFRANRALGGQAPFDILNSTFGRTEVKNLIGRIDYGVYS